MRALRAMLAALFLGGALFAALPAGANPSDACDGDPAAVGDSSVTVCITGTGVADGSLTASQEGDTDGYIVADGDSGNPGCLDGYVGIQVAGGEPGVAAGAGDTYSYPAEPAGEPDPEQTIEDCSP